MYKCLIVDDDRAICRGLPLLIDWETYGFHIANTANNGEQALALLKKNSYDLLITDIRMPKLDGIGLIRRLAEEGIQINTIILSGYRDFEYAQVAVEFGVKQYILKPINEELLINTLRNLKIKMDESSFQKVIMKESQTLLAESSWNELLKGGPLSADSIEKLTVSGFKHSDYSFRTLVIDPAGQSARMLTYIKQLVSAYQSGDIEMKILQPEKNRYVLILAHSLKASGSSKTCAEKIGSRICTEFGKNVKIAVGSEARLPEVISKSYQDALLLFDVNAFSGQESLVFYDEIRVNHIIAPVLEYIRANCHDKISLRSIASRYYLNPAYLGRLFKQQTGMVFNEYLVDCRIDLAKKHLQNKSAMISDIAEKVGYSDVNHFCHIFKSRTGLTPSDYRSGLTKE